MSERLMTLKQARNDPAAQAVLRRMSKGMFSPVTSRDNTAQRSYTTGTDTLRQASQPEKK